MWIAISLRMCRYSARVVNVILWSWFRVSRCFLITVSSRDFCSPLAVRNRKTMIHQISIATNILCKMICSSWLLSFEMERQSKRCTKEKCRVNGSKVFWRNKNKTAYPFSRKYLRGMETTIKKVRSFQPPTRQKQHHDYRRRSCQQTGQCCAPKVPWFLRTMKLLHITQEI